MVNERIFKVVVLQRLDLHLDNAKGILVISLTVIFYSPKLTQTNLSCRTHTLTVSLDTSEHSVGWGVVLGIGGSDRRAAV